MTDNETTTIQPTVKKRRRAAIGEFARLDPAIFGLPLFRPMPRRWKTKEDNWRNQSREYDIKFNGEQIHIVCPYMLTSSDLGILLALLSLSGQDRHTRILTPVSFPHHEDFIKNALKTKGKISEYPHITVTCSYDDLLEVAGISVRKHTKKDLREKLRRLRAVFCERTVIIGNQEVTKSSGDEQLLGYDSLNEDGDNVITLSERLTAAILGKPYIRVPMPLWRKLSSEVARILYVRLCVLIREGEIKTKSMDDIVSMVYGDSAGGTQQQIKDQRRAIKNAFDEINKLGDWTIEINTKVGVMHYDLARKTRQGREAAQHAMELER